MRAGNLSKKSDKRADYVLPCHDEVANARSDVFPYDGMPIRKRRQTIPGYQFYFGDMPTGIADKAAPALTKEEAEQYIAGLKNPIDMAEYKICDTAY